MQQAIHSPARNYSYALLAVVLAGVLRTLLHPILGEHYYFFTFTLATTVTAWYAGFYPALLAILVSVVAVPFIFFEPAFALRKQTPIDQVAVMVFLIVSIMIAFLSGAMHEARRRAEDALVELRATQELFETFMNAAPFVVYIKDKQGRYLYANSSGEKLSGLPIGELIGRTDFDVFPEGLAKQFRQNEEKVLASGNLLQYEEATDGLHRDGAHTWMSYKFPVHDTTGRLLLGSLSIDVTEHKRAEELLRESEERLRLVIEAAQLGSWDWDLRSGRILWNRWHETIFGYEPGRPHREYADFTMRIPPEELARVEAGFRKAKAERSEYRLQHRIIWPNGSVHWVESHGRFYYDAQGQPIRSLGIVLDVTERKRLETALQQRVGELAQIDRRKDEFLAILAHELRNPLAPIRNAVEFLRARMPADLVWARDIIDRQLAQLTRLVDDLLDVSRITRGRIELHRRPLEIRSIVERTVETSQPLIEAAGHELSVSIPEEKIWINADETRMSQVISNLLNNAAKYTKERGHIWLTVQVIDNEAVIEIRDSGVGIPPEMLPRIFDLFTQVNSSIDRAQGGLGIGLTLVKALVELHEGTISVASEGIGKGSRFTVHLPLAAEVKPPQPAPGLPAPAAAGAMFRIMVADDNKDSAESMALLLELQGHTVQTAHDGPSALELAKRFKPAIALLDIGMPGMSGYELAKALAVLPELKPLTLIAQTGWGQEEDRRRSREAGFDYHLVKPVDSAALREAIQGVSMLVHV